MARLCFLAARRVVLVGAVMSVLRGAYQQGVFATVYIQWLNLLGILQRSDTSAKTHVTSTF